MIRRSLLIAQSSLCIAAIAVRVAAEGGTTEPVPDIPSTAAFGPPPTGDLPPPPRPVPLAESLSGDAKREFDSAVILYSSGDFAGAALKFRSAYALSGDVRLLWNQAACEQASRHYVKAIALVRTYLASRSALITPEAEQSALAFLEAALPLTARLLVDTNVPGTEVLVDGEMVGKTPLDAETRIDFGTHQLRLKKADFEDQTTSLVVTSAADLHVTLTLARLVHQGRLVVRAGKEDSITLDGRFVGLGSYDASMPSGAHALRVSAPHARTFESHVTIEDERTRAVDVVLEPVPWSEGVPTWVWIAGGSVLAVGAGTAGYFLFKSSNSASQPPVATSLGGVQLPLR
jgi:hypothetical protein